MYYAIRSESQSGIYSLSSTIKGFNRYFRDGDRILVYKKNPRQADYGYYYNVVGDTIKRDENKAVNVTWMAREFGL